MSQSMFTFFLSGQLENKDPEKWNHFLKVFSGKQALACLPSLISYPPVKAKNNLELDTRSYKNKSSGKGSDTEVTIESPWELES